MAKKAIAFLYAVTVLVVIFNTVFSVRDYLFADINKLPEGQFAYSVDSPNGQRKMNIYLVENRVGSAVRGELESQSGVKNVFWQTGINSVEVGWNGDGIVTVNGIPLDSEHPYDCRRGTSLFTEGSLVENFTEEPSE